MLYRHILAAYDGSPASEDALKQAIKLTEHHSDGKLTVLHALHRPTYLIEGFVGVIPDAYQEQMKAYEDAIIQKAKVLTAMLPHVEIVVREGLPAAAVLETAEKRGCDLIVMGSRGLGAVKEWVLGSVSHHVVQHARVPVLIVK